MGNGPDDSSDWDSNRERITYEEGRNVLEAQKTDIDDIDDKALRTVRITAVLLGVGATGARVIGISNINTSAAAISLLSFLLSLLFGVMVYNESDEVIGPTSSYLGKMRENDLRARWEDDLLVQFEGWIEDNQETVEFNGYLLISCEIFFVFGVGFGAASLLSLSAAEMTVIGALLLSIVIVVLAIIRGLVRRE